MKKKSFTIAALIASSMLLMQCASQDDVQNLDYQLRIVNKKVDDMKKGTVNKMRQRQAASSSQIEELRSEILMLKGQVDELNHYNRLLKEQNKEFERSITSYTSKIESDIQEERDVNAQQQRQKDEKIRNLENQLAQNQALLKSIQDARVREAKLKAAAAAREAEKARIAANKARQRIDTSSPEVIRAVKKKKIYKLGQAPKSIPPKAVPVAQQQAPTPRKNTSTNLMDQAKEAYRNGKYQKALDLYQSYAMKHSGDTALNANFMMGESLFQLKRYDLAILQYQKIVEDNPHHSLASAALLKQGICFETLADEATAKLLYKKVLQDYASSKEAITAQDRMNKL